ncbi:MAG: hypothetical protein QM490_05805 [Candidatus Gracilibacteria bacterium]
MNIIEIKKILIILIAIIGIFYVYSVSGANCAPNADSEFDVGQALDNCLEGSKLIIGTDAGIDSGGVSVKIKSWVDNIALYLGVFAVGSIVYGGLMMTLSAGEEDKITKSKDIVKWGIVGFLGVISASAIINLIVKIMYSL